MIRRSALIASAAAVLVIAGCSGNDDDANPSPTPTPTPTPTASATPTYEAFPIPTPTPGAVQLFSVSASMSYEGDPATGPVTLGTAGTDGFSNRVRFALQSTVTSAQTAETVVREAEREARFTGVDLLTAPATGVTEFVYRESTAPTTPGQFTQLELLNNTVTASPSVVTSDPLFGTLKRSTYGAWWRGDSTAGVKRVTYATMGYPTVSTDMPTTGTANYTVKLVGRSVVAPVTGAATVSRLGGTATVSINYATGLVNLTLNLTGYGTFTGTGAIVAGNNQFTGSFGPGSTAGGTFQGLAYGSQAAEIGITFAITQDGTGGASSSRAVGVVIGKKAVPAS